MKFFYLVWSNLKRKKLRTLLTLLSILIAFILFGFLSAIKQALVGGVLALLLLLPSILGYAAHPILSWIGIGVYALITPILGMYIEARVK